MGGEMVNGVQAYISHNKRGKRLSMLRHSQGISLLIFTLAIKILTYGQKFSRTKIFCVFLWINIKPPNFTLEIFETTHATIDDKC